MDVRITKQSLILFHLTNRTTPPPFLMKICQCGSAEPVVYNAFTSQIRNHTQAYLFVVQYFKSPENCSGDQELLGSCFLPRSLLCEIQVPRNKPQRQRSCYFLSLFRQMEAQVKGQTETLAKYSLGKILCLDLTDKVLRVSQAQIWQVYWPKLQHSFKWIYSKFLLCTCLSGSSVWKTILRT